MRVLVCGGRDFTNGKFLFSYMDEFVRAQSDLGVTICLIINGYARGADQLADKWAILRGIQPVRLPALWRYRGRGAGIARNKAMLALKPDLVIAFPGGRGTADMMAQAKAAKVRVIEVKP